jgi:hypothetical protein
MPRRDVLSLFREPGREELSAAVVVIGGDHTVGGEMRKLSIEQFEPRQSFSHARIKPLVVEKVNRRTILLCPSCGGKMKLKRKPKLTACCPRCEGK